MKALTDAVSKEIDESVFNELESLGNDGFSLGDIGCCISISDEE